ncbi:YheC/YheD family protein [Paenactinomyces guangxiensis]|uniref:YheC/YheD family protein n=1 Tax=Paenactinomyces guangxiensis TaxID=1490290 RepID=A0A7W2A7Y0_9BACL|nr:YheC/YheD family protein [Paenactinomyces guangxiensis]MBA4494075.1 YheC/YheD family protein [Paenactinomyces guangxiensis]MBH8591180.1 YheC/YheD family protein [Paenactinomyces guangxiensis]
MGYPYQQIASKALKTMVLQKNERIFPYLPETYWYHPAKLKQMLDEYEFVFIKPDKGGGGGGAIRIKKWSDYEIVCHTLYSRKVLASSEVAGWIEKRLKPGKRYIMQQGIRLMKVQGRPFDLRIHMQKVGKEWTFSGICAKLAAPGKIVTNYCKGGQPYEAYKALLEISSYNQKRAKEIFVELYYLSKEIAKTLNSRFTGLKELGIDAGIDEQLRIWIFEVNTRPNFKMFRDLPSLHMYRRIKNIRYHRV